MPAIEISNLTKVFGKTTAVDDVSFGVERGEILVIVGASGCGKTTTLRCIAGLERPTAGTVIIGGKLMSSDTTFVPPERRGIGMMFQSYALWPHMTVFENIAYGLKIKGMPVAEIRTAVSRAIELVDLGGLDSRYPATLSGGQQQRVALARSTVTEPDVLLLDEPLSNLDAKLREQMRHELRGLIKKLAITAIYITHDQTEAMALADNVIYMRKGGVEQIGKPRQLYWSPINKHAADFLGRAIFLDGTVIDRVDERILRVSVAEGVQVLSRATVPLGEQAEVTLAIRPESVALSSARPNEDNVLTGKIVDESVLGSHTEYIIDCGAFRLQSHSQHEFDIGSQVFISIDPQRVICLPRQDVPIDA